MTATPKRTEWVNKVWSNPEKTFQVATKDSVTFYVRTYGKDHYHRQGWTAWAVCGIRYTILENGSLQYDYRAAVKTLTRDLKVRVILPKIEKEVVPKTSLPNVTCSKCGADNTNWHFLGSTFLGCDNCRNSSSISGATT